MGFEPKRIIFDNAGEFIGEVGMKVLDAYNIFPAPNIYIGVLIWTVRKIEIYVFVVFGYYLIAKYQIYLIYLDISISDIFQSGYFCSV